MLAPNVAFVNERAAVENTCFDDRETIREFMVESHENLEHLDRDLVDLEKRPDKSTLLRSVFRTVHTIKGACGFLALSQLERISHQAETRLSQSLDGKRELNLIAPEPQGGAMKTRMRPIGVVGHSLPRVMRDIAVSLGKQIQIKIDGIDAELDRTIIEAIKDPLTRLLRHSSDHGIELPEVLVAAGKAAGTTMTLRGHHEGGQVSMEDDEGAGIDTAVRVKEKAVEKGLSRPEQAAKLGDRETLNLILEPGFSTAQVVTKLLGWCSALPSVKNHILFNPIV